MPKAFLVVLSGREDEGKHAEINSCCNVKTLKRWF